MRKQDPEFQVIVSIAPISFYETLQAGTYVIEAAPAKYGQVLDDTGFAYRTLKVWDSEIIQVNMSEDDHGAKGKVIRYPADCGSIVDDLLNLWVRRMPLTTPDAYWGVGALPRGTEEVADEFLQRLVAVQAAFCRRLINQAEQFADTPGDRSKIGPHHQAAAIWMGLEDQPWLKRDFFDPIQSQKKVDLNDALAEMAKGQAKMAEVIAALPGILAGNEGKSARASAKQ